ncbi:MAG: glycine radical domain-containing protein, partial [Promethearchaeota archaeon]
KLENELMTNGNSTLLNFHPNTMRSELFLPLIRSFFVENGGYHIQFNVIGRNTLCDAQNNPKNYPGLVVRIAGYPVLFNELSKSAQDDIIARTEF